MEFDRTRDYHRTHFSGLLAPMLENMGGGLGRIYVTSPMFGIDLSVDSVRGSLRTPRDISYGNFEQDGFMHPYCREFELVLTFSMPSLSVMIPGEKTSNGLFKPKLDGKTFLLDHNKPIPPRLPIWLPPGVWQCEFCNGMQSEGLLQCRGCGAMRIEAEHEYYKEAFGGLR